MIRDPRHQPVVLIIDDDPSMQLLAGEALDAAGFVPREAADGEAALALFAALRPDLVLLDVVMPGLDGFEVCARLRQLPGGADVPVMMMTGTDDIESLHRAFEAGATDFITKPLNYSILGYRLRYMQRAREKQDELRLSQQRLTDAQRLARLGNWEWNLVSGEVMLTEQSAGILGLGEGVTCRTLSDMLGSVHPDDRERVLDAFDRFVRTQSPLAIEHKVVRADGGETIVFQEAEALVDESNGRLRLTGTFQDITERKRVEQRIAHLEHHDSLTNLPNRSFFLGALGDHIEGVEEEPLAVFELAIDQLARVTDTLGHEAAERLVCGVADRLAATLGIRVGGSGEWGRPDRPLLARDATGSFLLMQPGLHDSDAALGPARAIADAFESPICVGVEELFVTVSIGIAVYPMDGGSAEQLLRNAQTARSSLRGANSSRFCFYADSMNANALERLQLESALRRAVEAGAFELHYQAKVATEDGRPCGMEALLRWNCPGIGPVSPGKFIPIAEELGLVVPIGKWVIEEVCRQLAQWDAAGLPALVCSVNVASIQLDTAGFEELVLEALEASDIDPCRLELELTERALMSDDAATLGLLQRLREQGCRVSLDDFGTGYSSLSYLNRFPLDVVKLDRSFILDVPGSEDKSTLVAALIELAKKLRLHVVAEGVENEAQHRFLLGTGCDEIQGYYFAKPLGPADFEAWVRAKHVEAPPVARAG